MTLLAFLVGMTLGAACGVVVACSIAAEWRARCAELRRHVDEARRCAIDTTDRSLRQSVALRHWQARALAAEEARWADVLSVVDTIDAIRRLKEVEG